MTYPTHNQLEGSIFIPHEGANLNDSPSASLQHTDLTVGMPGTFELIHMLTPAEYDSLYAHYVANDVDSFNMTWQMPDTARTVPVHWLGPPERLPVRPSASNPDLIRTLARLVKDRYRTTATDYNGSTYLTSAFIGEFVDGKEFIFCCAFKPDNAASGSDQFLIYANNETFSVRITGTGRIRVYGKNTSSTVILDCSSEDTTDGKVTTDWNAVTIAGNLATGVVGITLNGRAVADSPVTATDDNIEFTRSWAIGASFSGANHFAGNLCQLALWNGYFNASKRANWQALFDSRGRPVEWPDGGLRVDGNKPPIWIPDGDPTTNAGTGADFTVASGSLSAAADSPTD